MDEVAMGTIYLFAGNFAPRGWALCNGQILSINDNQALFALLGTNYGGDGRTTFGLPDLRGRIPVHFGSGSGLTPVALGQKMGQESTILIPSNIPQATIEIGASSEDASLDEPSGKVFGVSSTNAYSSSADESLKAGVFPGSSSMPINNIQPTLGLNFIICTSGLFPSRS